MPDYWENLHSLNPAVADHNGTGLSVGITGVSGYTNLECYLNCLADALVSGGTPACGIVLGASDEMAGEGPAGLEVWPNPSAGVFAVQLRGGAGGNPGGFGNGRSDWMEVMDVHGVQVATVQCTGRGTVDLDLRHLPSGVYLLRFGSVSKRLMIR